MLMNVIAQSPFWNDTCNNRFTVTLFIHRFMSGFGAFVRPFVAHYSEESTINQLWQKQEKKKGENEKQSICL